MNNLLKVLQTTRPIRGLVKQSNRTFLSQAYSCNDAWNQRCSSQILSKVHIDELYYDLDQRFVRTGAISAVDVDIYANKVQDEAHVDEFLDLIHKLRMSSETSNTLESTGHAVIRYLLTHNKTAELITILDDRLNYGVFLDYYTANLLMDHFYKQNDFVAGCKIASQMMLQEEFKHPITKSLALLHCYKYLCDPKGWPAVAKVEEPEEEVKVRVKYLRNPYDDGHFDLKTDLHIVGKTLMEFTRDSQQSDLVDRSLHVLGSVLLGKEFDKTLLKNNLHEDVLKLIADDNPMRKELQNVFKESGDVLKTLEDNVVKAEQKVANDDVTQQVKLFAEWEDARKTSLDNQLQRLEIAHRIESIKHTQEDLKTREEKLWFFENQEQIELGIENKKVYYPKRWFGKKKKPRKVDEAYVPPEL